MNATNFTAGTAGPRTGMSTILGSIGTAVLNDPNNLGPTTGIAKPIDILCLQEVYEVNRNTGIGYANLLNTMYGTTTFSYGTIAGGSSGSGTQGVIYNSAKVTLTEETAFGTVNTSSLARQVVRHKFSLVGYGPEADFYIYNSHYKSSSGDTARRLAEATAVRDNADALGANKNIIHVGDFNVFNSSESGYQELLSAGNAKFNDPINKPGNWNDSSTFKNIHTQTPYDAAIGQPGFDGGGGMDSRFDLQLITNNLNDRNGLAYIPNSYQTFGNNGSHVLGSPLNTGNGASPAALAALSSILDHLPVGADYQLPAKMSVAVGSVPSTVITGASVPVNVTVTNSAPVQFSNGADGLTYAVTSAGSLSGSANVADKLALTSGNNHALNLSTAAPGVSSGTVSVNSSSEAVANGAFSAPVSTTVLAHSTPSFAADSSVSVATINFGIKGKGLGQASSSFSIANLADASGFTAKLDLDSFAIAGDVASLGANVGTFSNLSAGSLNTFSSSMSDANNGSFTETYTLNFSDENLLGATARGPLTLVVTGIVATPGDTDLNGIIDFDDYSHIDNGFNNNRTGWENGDFDGNGIVDFDDYSLIDFNFNNQSGALARAISYLDGTDRSDHGMNSLSLKLVEEHLDQFGETYAASFLNAVPEPSTLLFGVQALACMTLRRKRRTL
ncbi:MAG: hypothetical protein H7Z14_22265 [Anaerolineae bacterium]|nr:hypothetical protein [Phycisphaerae bacterium]